MPIILCAGIIGLCAMPALAETLPDTVRQALSTHPRIQAVLSNNEAVAADAREARSGLFPSVNVKGAGGRNFADNSTSRGLSVTRGSAYSWLWEGSITMTQLLFDGFETTKQIDAATARESSAGYEVLDARENLALQAVLSYLDVLRTGTALQKLQSHRERLTVYLDRIRQMVEDGGADASMLAQARDIKAQLENAIINAHGERRGAQARYTEIVGQAPGDDLVRPVPRLDMIPESSDTAIAYAEMNHPAVKARAMAKTALAHEVEAQKVSIYPDFTGELSYYERDQEEIIGGEVRDAKAIVRMNWDYSIGGAYDARVRKSMHREAESRAELEEIRRRIAREISVAYSERQTATGQIKIQQDRVALNSDLLDTYENQFEAGRVNILQIMRADNVLFNSQMGLMNGEFRLLASQYSVLASMGRLQQALGIESD